jgi:hypothetical protein
VFRAVCQCTQLNHVAPDFWRQQQKQKQGFFNHKAASACTELQKTLIARSSSTCVAGQCVHLIRSSMLAQSAGDEWAQHQLPDMSLQTVVTRSHSDASRVAAATSHLCAVFLQLPATA